MVSVIAHVTIDAADPYELASWWCEVLGLELADDDEPGDPEAFIALGADGLGLLFVAVPDEKAGKNRVHLDLRPTDRTRDDEIDRLRALGATAISDHRRTDGSGWMVLADPEGNEFCVERSDQER